MENLKLTMFYLGCLDCQYFRLVNCDDETRRYQSPISAILIQHPTLGNILYDTGNSPYSKRDYGAHINQIYPVKQFISIEEALTSKGLTCGAIDRLIFSHLHFDHVGGLNYFAGTKAIKNVTVSRPELLNACESVFTGNHGAYVKKLFDVDGVVYKPIEGTVELAPDLTLFVQQSHTPGVIGLIVKTRTEGNLIFTSDAVYTQDSWNYLIPPGGNINKTTNEFFDNIQYLKELQKKYNATMIFGHDCDQIQEWSRKGTIE